MKPFLSEAEPTCREREGWKRDAGKDCSIQDGDLCPHTGRFLRDGGKEISCPYSERKQRESWLMCWTCGAIAAEQRLVASKELSTQNRAERVEIVAAGSIFKIQSEILKMRIANKAFELLWMDNLFQEAPVSLPAWVPVGQSQKAALAWVEDFFIIFFLNQALSKPVVIPVFKSSLIFIMRYLSVSLSFSRELRKSCHPHHLWCRKRETRKELCVWLSGSEVHLRIPLGT